MAAASRFAAGIGRTAEKLGINVPDDLMLASLTDSEHSRGHSPAISAVDLVLEDLAAATVELMLHRLAAHPPPDPPVVLRPILHRRASSSPNLR